MLFPFYIKFDDYHEISHFSDQFNQAMKNNSHISFFKKEKIISYELGLVDGKYIGLFYDQSVPQDVIQAIQSLDIESLQFFKNLNKIISIYHQHQLFIKNIEKKNKSDNPIISSHSKNKI